MRISDWSSDVCSSDLKHALHAKAQKHTPSSGETCPNEQVGGVLRFRRVFRNGRAGNRLSRGGALQCQLRSSRSPAVAAQQQSPPCPGNARSEEHTSELQSLMRISYAVFCLKKKNRT